MSTTLLTVHSVLNGFVKANRRCLEPTLFAYVRSIEVHAIHENSCKASLTCCKASGMTVSMTLERSSSELVAD